MSFRFFRFRFFTGYTYWTDGPYRQRMGRIGIDVHPDSKSNETLIRYEYWFPFGKSKVVSCS